MKGLVQSLTFNISSINIIIVHSSCLLILNAFCNSEGSVFVKHFMLACLLSVSLCAEHTVCPVVFFNIMPLCT